MVNDTLRKSDPATRKRPTSVEGATPATNLSSISASFNYIPDLELDDQIIHCWAGISNAMHTGNEKLFRSHKHTTDIIQSGKYTNLLREFQPILRDWWTGLNATSCRPSSGTSSRSSTSTCASTSTRSLCKPWWSAAPMPVAPRLRRGTRRRSYPRKRRTTTGNSRWDKSAVSVLRPGIRQGGGGREPQPVAHRRGRPTSWRLSQTRSRAHLLPHHQRRPCSSSRPLRSERQSPTWRCPSP